MSDNKLEEAGAPEIQLEPSSAIDAGAIGAGAESKSPTKSANDSPRAPVATNPNDGGAHPGKEKAPSAADVDDSLGAFLIAARERRGFSAKDVVRETRLPAHYLRMMETNDYSEISDQLYLVPFLRRYARFLDLDQEDVAMRFVREVQRSDNGPPPARLDQPLIAEPRRHRGWSGALLVIGILVAVVGVYYYESQRHRQVSADTLVTHSNTTVVTGADAGGAPAAPQPSP